MVLDKGHLVYRAPTPQAVDYYMAAGFTGSGERIWTSAEIPADAAPFAPIALRLRDKNCTRGRYLALNRAVHGRDRVPPGPIHHGFTGWDLSADHAR